MSGVGKVDDRNWANDVGALAGSESISTTAAAAKSAQDATGRGAPLMHANDASYDELLDHYKSIGENKGEIAELAVHAVEGLEGAEAIALGTAAAVALPVLALGYGIHHLAEANQRGHELNVALMRDEQKVAILANAALPEEFQKQEIAKFPHASTTNQGVTQKMTSWIKGGDHALMTVIQLNCDKGMNAARDMLVAPNVDRAAWLAGHPAVAKLYQSDFAFKEGFDAMVWAHDKGGDALAKLTSELDTRDARYGASGVSYRA